MARSWTIGSSLDCDLVVDRPVVSGHHCRLTREGDDFLLEDLGSTNGTYVNGERVKAPVASAVPTSSPSGRPSRCPGPTTQGRPAVEGAADRPRAGQRPRREPPDRLRLPRGVVWEGKPGEAVVEDLNSSNGTAVGSPDRG
ncbi:MAG: FHA domain-containing protein [Singulisphaera sp.]